jgi:hypothetical protein
VYTTPDGSGFNEETVIMAKLQIDNSFELGWKPEDILLFTTFDYEYRGVKATIVPYFPAGTSESNKVPVISYLLENNMLDDKELYWYHDFDAYQLIPITEAELEMENYDIGFTTYVYKPHWNCGVFFFKTSARDLFKTWTDNIFIKPTSGRNDEKSLYVLTRDGVLDVSRCKTMNARYNVTMRDVGYSWYKAKKPLVMVHFHPYYHDHLLPDTILNTFMYGKNITKKPLMTDRLIKLFHKYGIK